MALPITLDQYQNEVKRTLNYNLTSDQQLANLAMGIAGEAGEIADSIKKHLFQGHDLDLAAIRKELGDLEWYVANLANHYGISLAVILEENVSKLRARYPDGFDADRSINRTEYSQSMG